MRSYLFLALLPAALWAAAPALKIENTVISQMEGGDPDPAGYEHIGGETVFFWCNVSGFTKDSDNKVHLSYSIQATDAKGAGLAEATKSEVLEEILPQDKDWMPKLTAEIQLPPLLIPGDYKIVVKIQDVLAEGTVESSVPFRVRGHLVSASDTLSVRNFGFYRKEEDTQAMDRALYHNGSPLVVKFDITGYKYGANNKIDVSYVFSILGADNRVLYKQPDADVEQSRVQAESFYPQPYVPEFMSLELQKVAPGAYTVLIQARDGVGKQTAEARRPFSVE